MGGNSKVTMLSSKMFRYNPYVAYFPLLYLPVWFNCCRALVGMSSRGNPSPEKNAAIPAPSAPSLESEGLLWFPDLTAYDPYLSAIFFGLLLYAPSGGFQGLRLVEISPTIRGWTGFKYWFYRCSPIVLPAIYSIGVSTYRPPAALALFCVCSYACAFLQRGLMRRWIGVGKNTIMPAHPREMRMRKVVAIDANGIPSYGRSPRVPKTFEDLFERTQIRPSPGRPPLTSDPAQKIAQQPSDRV